MGHRIKNVILLQLAQSQWQCTVRKDTLGFTFLILISNMKEY